MKYEVTRIYTTTETFIVDADNADEAEIVAEELSRESDGEELLLNLDHVNTVVEASDV